MGKFKKWKNKNRDILIKDTISTTGPTYPPPPEPPKELKKNGKKLKRGGKV